MSQLAARFPMNPPDINKPMLAAAARMLELTKQTVLDHPDPGFEHISERSADDPPVLRPRRAGVRAKQPRRERIG